MLSTAVTAPLDIVMLNVAPVPFAAAALPMLQVVATLVKLPSAGGVPVMPATFIALIPVTTISPDSPCVPSLSLSDKFSILLI